MEELLTEKFLKEIKDRVGDIMGAMEVLAPLVAAKGREKDQEYLAMVNKSFFRLLRMVRHAETCGLESISEEKTLDLAGLCRKLVKDGEDMARLLGTDFAVLVPKKGTKKSPPLEGSVLSHGDAYLLEMAILNLMTNAFEAAGPAGKVSFGVNLESERWMVTVEDNGPGLRDAEVGEDPYLKTPGGVGLGLETARKIAKLHGGALMQETAAEGGVRAVLSIPVRKPAKPLVKTAMVEAESFSAVLVEFSPLLPLEVFLEANIR